MVLREKGGLRELALFAGAGGGILGGNLLGWETVAACEIEEYPRAVLLQRQLDGCLPRFPVWDDIRTFDGRPFRGIVDIVTGGFPCQDISAAGKGEGITGARSGLWREMARIIGEVRPRYAFMENSPMLIRRGLTTVIADLAKMGYDARWCVLGADDAGAPHIRKRIWILADTGGTGLEGQRADPGGAEISESGDGSSQIPNPDGIDDDDWRHDAGPVLRERPPAPPIPDSDEIGRDRGTGSLEDEAGGGQSPNCSWWEFEPPVGRVANGVAYRVDRLIAIGNGQVPAVAALAWNILSEQGD